MNNEKDNRKFIIALLFAIIVHIIIFLLLYFQDQIDQTNKWMALKDLYQKEELEKEKYSPPITFQKEEPETKEGPKKPDKKPEPEPEKAEKPEKIAPPKITMPEPLSDAALIPGASSDKTILDAGNNKVLEIEEGARDNKEPIKPELATEDVDIETEETVKEIIEEIAQAPKEVIKAAQLEEQPSPTTYINSESVKRVAEKPINKARKAKTIKSKLPIILKRETSSAPKLKNVIEGFTKYMNENGNNAHLERAGSKNGVLNFEEAKLISYYNKVIEFFKGAQENMPEYVKTAIISYARRNSQQIRLQAYFKLVISSDGKLEKINILENSGVREYDDFIYKRFQNASPYPPIPKHLNKKEIIFPIGIYVLLKEPPGSRFFF